MNISRHLSQRDLCPEFSGVNYKVHFSELRLAFEINFSCLYKNNISMFKI